MDLSKYRSTATLPASCSITTVDVFPRPEMYSLMDLQVDTSQAVSTEIKVESTSKSQHQLFLHTN